MFKKISLGILALMIGIFASACASSEAIPQASASEKAAASLNAAISVVSREDGSGTRGAFIELFGIEEKNEDGSKTDRTTQEAIIANKTDIMLSNIAGSAESIGYVSLGSLNDTVKALEIDSAAASVDNIKNGSYKIARPFNIATKGAPSPLSQDFIDFILSQEGQAVVAASYISIDDAAPAFVSAKPEGKITVAGSSSVTPIMEKLKEAYEAINPQGSIEIQQSDSSTGLQAAIDGTCHIAMASRELKESETAELTGMQIALDGIAVIVNRENPINALTGEQVKAIFTGEIADWAALSN